MSVKNLSLSFGAVDIFTGVSFELKKGAVLGFIGSNGSGKTSLLKILCGLTEGSEGEITKGESTSIKYLSQLSDYTSELTVWQDVMSVYDDVFETEERLRDIERQMAESPEKLESLSKTYENLTRSFEDMGGYSAERMARSVLSGLGIKSKMYERSVNTLSGGQRARVQLAMSLLRSPDILLMDEPTNHLDLDAIKWLENFISNCGISLIIVSHDRYFLDNVCTGIIELSMGSLSHYPDCTYSDYLIEKEMRFEKRQKLFESNQAEIKRHQAVIRRYRSWATEKAMKTAKVWEKRLEKLERIDKPTNEKIIKFNLDTDIRSGNDVIIAEGLAKNFGQKHVFNNLDLHIRSGEKIALMGPNGVGKTTLLKIIAGALRQDSGDMLMGTGVKIGYYDQHQQNLNENSTAQDEIWDAYRGLTPQQVRDTLALFLFTGDDIFKSVSMLSGGERGRLSLLKLMLSKANFLLLDEPTNHLDMDSRQVLESALYDFPGTLLFVSHDRYFINSIATRILEMSDNGITSFDGSWDEYQYHLSLKADAESLQSESKTERARRFKENRVKKNEEKKLKDKLNSIEKKIFDCEIKKATAEKRLTNTEELNEVDISTYSKQFAQCEKELAALMDEWEEISSRILE